MIPFGVLRAKHVGNIAIYPELLSVMLIVHV
jgi:hypothetical protein